jgi:ribosome-associated protein
LEKSPEEIVSLIVETMDEKKASQIVTLNLEGISLIADYFVICHGNSDVQVQAIAREIKKVADKNDVNIRNIEGLDTARWVLMDLGDVVVHIFHRDEREYYNIERLWSDAKIEEHV